MHKPGWASEQKKKTGPSSSTIMYHNQYKLVQLQFHLRVYGFLVENPDKINKNGKHLFSDK